MTLAVVDQISLETIEMLDFVHVENIEETAQDVESCELSHEAHVEYR